MRTVKDVSKLTGISVRTLHYYDEIGLLKPTSCSAAGYRLYDDKALERLQQILFFREFDMPLLEIKAVMENPALDRDTILRSQKKMLQLKKDRLNRLISSIDDILKGENEMDFAMFDKAEIEEMCRAIVENLKEEELVGITGEYGNLENFQKHFVENASDPSVQENFKKVVEWYGNKDAAMNAVKNPNGAEVVQAYQNRIDGIYHKIADKKGADTASFEIKSLIGELDFVSKQLYQMPDVKKLMLDMAELYLNDESMKKTMDARYGEGAAEYIGEAVKEFYK